MYVYAKRLYRFSICDNNIGAEIVTNTISGVPYHSIRYNIPPNPLLIIKAPIFNPYSSPYGLKEPYFPRAPEPTGNSTASNGSLAGW